MNPFDLRGPEFLLFFVVLAALVTCAAIFVRRRMEDAPREFDALSDPYAIAYLRAGALDAARTAAVSLAQRGLLAESDGKLAAADAPAGSAPSDSLERAILERGDAAIGAAATDAAVEDVLEPRRELLVRRGLLPTADERRTRILVACAAAALLAGVAIAKVVIALGRGRTNVGFLVVLGVVATLLAIWLVLRPRRTPLGDRTVAHLMTLLGRAKDRAAQRPADVDAGELALLVAVYGAMAAPPAAFPAARALFFPPAPQGSSCGATTVSSCGSSCGGGGGCGGGGCGGCGGG